MEKMGETLKNKLPRGGGGGLLGGFLKFAAGAGVLAYTLNQSLFNVEGGHRAVMFNRLSGVKDMVIEEGTHFRLPWFDMPSIYDVRTRPCNISSLTGSKDLQMVNVSLRLLHKPDIGRLPEMHKQIGPDYDEKVLPSIGNEVLKSVIAQYTASELLTKREMVSAEIRRRLIERARDFNLILDDVAVTHVGFGEEYMAAVEKKQVAQQEAERARILVRKAQQDRDRTIIHAEAESAAARMIGEAMENNPGFLHLRRIEAARSIAKTVSRSANRVYLGSDSLLMAMGADFAEALKGDSTTSVVTAVENAAKAEETATEAPAEA